jgi:predicted Zn-dependent peptidase
LNGHTNITHVKYFINGLRSEFVDMLHYIFEIITNPVIDEKMVADEKKIVMNELHNYLNDPTNKLLYKMSRVLYTDENIVNFYDIQLQIDNLRKITYHDIITYYKTVYIPNNVSFYICGKFTEDQTKQLLKTCRDIIHTRPVNHSRSMHVYDNVFSYKQQLIYHKNPTAKNTTFYINLPFSGVQLTYTEQTQLDIFVNSLIVSLFDILRTQQKLVYGVSVSVDNYPYGSVLNIFGSCIDPNIKQVLCEIFAYLSDIQRKVVELDGLDNEKEKRKMKLNDTKITPELLCNFYETQNHLNCTRRIKRTYTFQDMFKIIEKVDRKCVMEILRNISLDNAVIGYTSSHTANITLASIMPK